MGIAALVTWLLTAVGGFVMLGIWVSRGGPRERRADTQLPPAVIFSHFGLAALGLVLWIIYVATDNHAVAWVAFVLLVPVAALGFVMLARWLPVYRGRAATTAATGAAGATPDAGGTAGADLPERHFPVPVVAGHGLLAVVTVVLALLAALDL
jgi:manganese efflux pump family protein